LPKALRDLAALPKSDQERITKRIDALASDPRPPGAKAVQGQHGLFRLRSGNYRILYRIEDVRLLVLVVKIGHRRDVYRGL